MSDYDDGYDFQCEIESRGEDLAEHLHAIDPARIFRGLPEALAKFDCEHCDGHGEVGYEPPGWWHGSGVFTVTSPCGVCHGEGVVDFPPLAQMREAS